MIHFITGKPGGGKSMYAVMQVIRELVRSDRDVVTNLPIRIEVLSEYLQAKYPRRHIDLVGPNKRLHLLDEGAEVRSLYRRYRNKWVEAKGRGADSHEIEAIYQGLLAEMEKIQVVCQTAKFWEYRNPRKLRFDEAVGTLFVLDEVHLYFNARRWQETGAEAISYLSQHRHFSDDVILVTQHADNVDQQFRRLVEDWSVIKNGYTQKIGYFRALPRFTRSVYTTQPTGGVRSVPFEKTTFTLDAKGIAACYNTAAAAGVMANGADTKKPAPGLHPYWFLAAVVVFGLLLAGVIKGVNAYAMGKVTDTLPVSVDPVPQDKPQAVILDASPSPVPVVVQAESKTSPSESLPRVRGVVWSGNRVTVTLTDGQVFTEDDMQVGDYVKRGRVRVAGVNYAYEVPAARVNSHTLEKNLPLSSSPGALERQDNQANAPVVNYPPPPGSAESAWQTHSDGVTRLKANESLADLMSPYAR